ncbi:helicase domain protein [Methanocaldococcus vulcanius M7]|uniref:Helicase domain protein n=1 Tax=Methanocaldococcus vulcanius (strain ATCC 700851 / DSM 12094 / M7) TaxID=579137 RepID=C9RHN1_METVM|nr:helicase-related protein [Methanocaldococcus vulcanius]ACX73083.1 helicase domain protein [Methanocaldococcus vulcanius M7]
MVNIIDNSNIKLADFIKRKLKKSKEAKFALGYFFLSGWDIVKNDLPDDLKDEFLKIVIGDETTEDTAKEISKGYKLRVKTKIIEELSEAKNEEKINELYELIKNNKIDIKIYDKGKLHAKLYLFLENPDELNNDIGSSPGVAVVGSSNFTKSGLINNKELNVVFTDREAIINLNEWFNKLWEESSEFREELLKIIEISMPKGKKEGLKLGKYITPKELFKFLVWKWFDGRIEPIEKRDILADFQLIGVINAINIINSHNGVIIADSVGLGKSFIGATLIEEYLIGKIPEWDPNKYGINKDRKALLILPPPLIPQWEDLLLRSPFFFGHSEYYVRKKEKNELDTDKYRVYEIYKKDMTKVGEIGFLSLGIFSNLSKEVLEHLSYEYDLILIDEAHKFRNSQTNRWRNAHDLRFKENDKIFQNKFILLTATPLNNTIWDIYYLIKMFSDDLFSTFKARGVNITELFREYRDLKKKFKENQNYDTESKLKLKAQEIKEKVLNEVMILRTRKYILENFGKDGKIKIGSRELVFKEPQPEKVLYDDIKDYKEYWEFLKNIANDLENLEFAYTKLYTSGYVVLGNSCSSLFEDKPEDAEKEKIAVPIHLILRFLIAKRLESSIYAFEKTLRKIYNKNKTLCEILGGLDSEIEKLSAGNLKLDEFFEKLKEITDRLLEVAGKEDIVEEGEIGEEESTYNPKVRMLINFLTYGEEKKELSFNSEEEVFNYLKKHPEMVYKLKEGIFRILNEMKKDNEIIEKIIGKLDNVKVKNENGNPITVGVIIEDNVEYPIYVYKDPKLKKLRSLMYNELVGKKYVIFTQYKDTAKYLYHSLIKYVERQKSTLTYLFDTKRNKLKIGLVTGELGIEEKERLIKRFAPSVNNGYEVVEKEGEIEILISTDSLSEGVNLQEGDGVINYDLPWNPMVIVQRVGRVSRIGNEKDVFVKNFVPVQEIEVSVGLLAKLQEKIKDITLVVGKEFYILSSADEEISIETFGEKIKNLAELKLTELEEVSATEEAKEIMGGKIPEEVKAEFELLDFVQNRLGLKKEDFEDVKGLLSSRVPGYTLIEGDDIFGVFEVYRGDMRIGKKVVVYKEDKLEETTCREFIKLWNAEGYKEDVDFEKISNNLLLLRNKFKDEILPKHKGNIKGKGFIKNLYNHLYKFKKQRTLTDDIDRKKLDSVLSFLSWCELTTHEVKEFKDYLKSKGILDDKGNLKDNNPKILIELIYGYFNIGELNKKLEGKMIAWWC